MQIKDSLTLDASGLTRSKDGYLVAEARVSRAGNVQQYYGSELGLVGDEATKMFGVYRDPDVVFDKDSMSSLAGRPVTRGHPPEGVNAQTWKDLSVGAVGGCVVRDGEHVVASMAIMDATAASEVENGARALSAGYTVGITQDAGIAPNGEPYQYRQTGPLRFNHVAYLPDNNPRAGNTRFGDSGPRNWGVSPLISTADRKGSPMADTLHNVVLGDEVAQVAIADAPKIKAYIDGLKKDLADAEKTHSDAIEAKDEVIGTLKADKKALEDAAITPEKLTKMVADRVALETMVKAIDKDAKTENVSDADLRKAAVAKVLGDDAVADASDAEISGMFKAVSKTAAKGQDTMRDAAKGVTIANYDADPWAFLNEKKEG